MCFLDAADAGTPAVLVIRSSGTEGAPHRTQYRVLAKDRIELVSDNSRDPMSDGGTDRTECTSAVIDGPFLDVDGCELGERIDR
jgi:hypothetical protein